MSTNDQFDELARRKLAERDFPFQEAHWLEAQRAIAAQGQQRRGGAWMYIAGVAAVIVALWLLWPSDQPVQVTEVNNGRAQHPVEADAAMVGEKEGEQATTTSRQVQEENERVLSAAQKEGSNVGGSQVRAVQQHHPNASSENRQRNVPQTTTVTTGEGSLTPLNEVARPIEPVDGADQGSTALAGSSASNGSANVKDPTPVTGSTTYPQTVPNTSSANGSVSVVATGDTGSADTTVPDPQGTPVGDQELAQSATADASPMDPLNSEPEPAINSDVPDSAVVNTDPRANVAPNDTTTTPLNPPIVPPFITARSPWEFTALGGLFNTTSAYSGGNSAAWSVDPQHTIGFCAEYVHMGRNVGLGGGIHYGSYADRLRTQEESRSVLTTTPAWYLQPVDTTILLITGSYTDSLGVVHYTGQNIDVTINELRMTLDSTYASTVIRQAMERINRTSYVEAVGLVDAHLVQGRWTFGVRGGPSIGLLTEHRGAIPSGEEGYTEFADLPMKTVVMGWTARAYVRYRFNAAWSVGIEPAARGQFNVAFDQEGITRRSSALGCMLSLTYRLR